MKCLVWDLDRTLWPCTLLEGGDPTLSDEIREVIIGLDARGILQSVASRNDDDHAWEWLEKLGVAEYFVLPHIGWGAKSASVRAITDRLGFASEAMAFIDDQHAERAEVSFHLPQVRCYDATQAASLLTLPEFMPATITTDSARRREMYQAGFRRAEARTSYAGPDEEFLTSLGLVMTIGRATEHELARVEELTLRTSQMNATGVHYSDVQLRGLLSDPRHEVLVVTLSDRFGPHGAVGVVLLAKYAQVWHLKLLATSCRVVAFGAGSVLLRWLADRAAAADVHLVADFRKTERNRMMEIAYRFAGFSSRRCDCLGAVSTSDVEHLHLVPQRHEPPTTMRLDVEGLA